MVGVHLDVGLDVYADLRCVYHSPNAARMARPVRICTLRKMATAITERDELALTLRLFRLAMPDTLRVGGRITVDWLSIRFEVASTNSTIA